MKPGFIQIYQTSFNNQNTLTGLNKPPLLKQFLISTLWHLRFESLWCLQPNTSLKAHTKNDTSAGFQDTAAGFQLQLPYNMSVKFSDKRKQTHKLA